MTETLAILIFVGSLFSFLALGVWVGAALLSTAAIGLALFTSRPIGDSMALTIWGEQSSWTLTALPLFIWMGEILFRTKLSETLFRGLAPFMRNLPAVYCMLTSAHQRFSRLSQAHLPRRLQRLVKCPFQNCAAGITPNI